ncbi:ABC transporter permease subunit [Nonomuraea phyllanthi]|uniref:Nickel import system permease protein NikB n=1 Tax=Nonomuraea phyllanthi TaxID=2219224 RepID=A0A5C4UZB9_9ACTN|nr:nickel ABC transporter permease [Nonomuraea phyllanthi]KAB8183579.1 ABC transporter permease subunit [Nonomuraea phyllanthi]QFY09448.1 ABC transporter permease subunit [Nonomuraea phyllanthi]
MTAYLIRRTLFAVFVLWGAVTIVFLVLRLVPGDPAQLILGSDATRDEIAQLRERMGLNRPLVVQYGIYLSDVVRLDFGDSYRYHGDAMGLVMGKFPLTLQLAAVAMVIGLVLGISLGVVGALRVNRLADRVVSVFALLSQSMPSFWIGIMFILVFARQLHVFASGGHGGFDRLVLPGVTLALPVVAILIRLTRSGLLDVVHENYIQTARAKGLSERLVIFLHAIRNALIPIVTVAGLEFGKMFGGAVIVETVFSWPGVGRLLIDSISARDYNVVQAAILLIAGGFVLINLVVDVMYGYLDPRIRLGR